MSFAPTLVTSCRRSTLYLPETDSRVTINNDLRWTLDMDGTSRFPTW